MAYWEDGRYVPETLREWARAFLFLFFVFALLIEHFDMTFRNDMAVRRSWPRVAATVQNAQFTGRGKYRQLEIRYHYTAGSQTFDGADSFGYIGGWSLPWHLRSVKGAIPAGTIIEVHHDPIIPSKSTIDPSQFYHGPSGSTRALVIVALAGAIVALRKRKSSKAGTSELKSRWAQ